MTEEQIKFLNEECNTIEFIQSSKGKNFDIDRGLNKNRIIIKDVFSLKKILKHLKDISKIKNIYLWDFIDFKYLKSFKFVKEITSYVGELTVKKAMKINDIFPNIEKVYFNQIDKKVLDIYDKLNYRISTFDERFNVDIDNEYFKYLFSDNNLNKFELLKRENLTLRKPINYELLKELISYTKIIDNLVICFDDFEQIIEVYKYLKNNKIDIKKITVYCLNKNYNLSILDKLNKKLPIYIVYDVETVCTLEEFKMMRSSINYYTSLIKSNDLSPLEEIIFAYDIVKSFTYKFGHDEENDMEESRQIHRVIKDGAIVCVGYSKMFVQILKELKISAEKVSIYCGDDKNINVFDPNVTNHMRVLVKIDDNKYNIHGIYSFDPTFDSNRENEIDLDRYDCFMIPTEDYKNIFNNDSYPKLYCFYFNIKTRQSKILEDVISCNYNTNELSRCLYSFFETINPDKNTLNRYMSALRIDEENFKSALRKVRIAEGYDEIIVDKEICKVLQKKI